MSSGVSASGGATAQGAPEEAAASNQERTAQTESGFPLARPPYENETVAASTKSDFDVQVHDDTTTTPGEGQHGANEAAAKVVDATAASAFTGKMSRRHRPGRRRMRTAHVQETTAVNQTTEIVLPLEQYETELYRRAICKPLGDTTNSASPPLATPCDDEDGGEIYGDVSLGMKLNIMGGKVIVQSLNPLADGRASPAQLAGKIQRGDVLLQINGVLLVNLPLDQLMKGLDPLSTPDRTSGAYQRHLSLRLASGRGLDLLRQAELNKRGAHLAAAAAAAMPLDPAADMFSLFPVTDSLPEPPSPVMMAEPILENDVVDVEIKPAGDEEKEEEGEHEATSAAPIRPTKVPSTLDEFIGQKLAEERVLERKKVISEFFSRTDLISLTLQYLESSESDVYSQTDADSFSHLTPAEMIDVGIRALKGAKALSAIMEKVDQGSDRRSFQSLSATLSLYSRASTRRRYVLDGRAMPVNFDKVEEDVESENDVDDGDASDKAGSDDEQGEQLDGDELLVQLAATDEVWRKQVLDFLEHAIEQSNEETSDDSAPQDANIDLSNELGSFLFGTHMTEVLKRNKKSQALPPPEITSLLFDLTTKISSSVPDRIKAEGDPISVRSSLVPFIGMKRPAAESNIMLANHFLLDQILPLWLKSFRPLPLDQRRILWPPDRANTLESTAGSTISDDSLTVDSMASKNTNPSAQRKSRKNLREQIEDNELDPESRAESCFITTYYFTQHLLPRLLRKGQASKTARSDTSRELGDFVGEYGAYLKLHTCLAYAAVLKSPQLIDSLLEVARFDPRHREVMKQTSRASALVIYDSTMLSSVMQRLKEIKGSPSLDRRRATINLCYQAYPDLRPWLVDRECHDVVHLERNSADGIELSSLYYSYLSSLLHPTDGHDGARQDLALVKEYCQLSVKGAIQEETGKKRSIRRKNFLRVASKTSSDHLAYKRDLPALLKLSMEATEFDLALDLAAEILDTKTNLNSEKSLRVLVEHVTNIGRRSVESFVEDKSKGTRVLKRVLRLYNRIATLPTEAAKAVVDIPLELISLLEHAGPGTKSNDKTIDLIAFYADEARPKDVIESLVRWCSPVESDSRLFNLFQTVLRKGAQNNAGGEMSASLYRVIYAHARLQESIEIWKPSNPSEAIAEERETGGLWSRISHGMLELEK